MPVRVAWNFMAFTTSFEGSMHMQYAWKRDTDVKMRQVAGIYWPVLEFGADQLRVRGAVVTLQLLGLRVFYPGDPRWQWPLQPGRGSALTQRESCCHLLNHRQASSPRRGAELEELTGRFIRGTGRELVQFWTESFTSDGSDGQTGLRPSWWGGHGAGGGGLETSTAFLFGSCWITWASQAISLASCETHVSRTRLQGDPGFSVALQVARAQPCAWPPDEISAVFPS